MCLKWWNGEGIVLTQPCTSYALGRLFQKLPLNLIAWWARVSATICHLISFWKDKWLSLLLWITLLVLFSWKRGIQGSMMFTIITLGILTIWKGLSHCRAFVFSCSHPKYMVVDLKGVIYRVFNIIQTNI